MKITVLVENTTENPNLSAEHGLSLYIETEHHRILFDAGDSTLFEENAKKLGIDLSLVDTFVLSHGHHDHGGGLNRFVEINDHAMIYAHQKAFDPHFSKRGIDYVNIGIPFPHHLGNRLVLIQNDLVIDNELYIFSKITGDRFYPQSNQNLYMDDDNRLARDDFQHEQHLIITENESHVLIAGCAHHGMLNIINEVQHYLNKHLKAAVGGLHMYSRSTGISESPEIIFHIAQCLMSTKVPLYTCHCTGEQAYLILKETMKDQISYVRTGSSLIL